MNAIINKLFSVGDEFMLEIHLRQLGFTFSACSSFTKNFQKEYKIKNARDLSLKKARKSVFLPHHDLWYVQRSDKVLVS